MKEKKKKRSALKTIAVLAGIAAGIVAVGAFLKKRFDVFNKALDFNPDYDEETNELDYDQAFDDSDDDVQSDAPQQTDDDLHVDVDLEDNNDK